MKIKCSNCNHSGVDKGRGFDSRRAYRCQNCGNTWAEGMQGKVKSYSKQRQGYQFADTGAICQKHKLILDTKLITLNEYIKLERTNRYAAAKKKKELTNRVALLAWRQKFKLPKDTMFDVHFIWIKNNNRIDHDNIAAYSRKVIFDGLTQDKIMDGKQCIWNVEPILKDDSPKYIRNFTDTFVLDRSKSYISCVVEFVEVTK